MARTYRSTPEPHYAQKAVTAESGVTSVIAGEIHKNKTTRTWTGGQGIFNNIKEILQKNFQPVIICADPDDNTHSLTLSLKGVYFENQAFSSFEFGYIHIENEDPSIILDETSFTISPTDEVVANVTRESIYTANLNDVLSVEFDSDTVDGEGSPDNPDVLYTSGLTYDEISIMLNEFDVGEIVFKLSENPDVLSSYHEIYYPISHLSEDSNGILNFNLNSLLTLLTDIYKDENPNYTAEVIEPTDATDYVQIKIKYSGQE